MNTLGPNYEAGVIKIEDRIDNIFMEMEKYGMDILIPLKYMKQIENGYYIFLSFTTNINRSPPQVRTRRTEYLRQLRGRQLHHLQLYFNNCFNGK